MTDKLQFCIEDDRPLIKWSLTVEGESGCAVVRMNGLEVLSIEPNQGHIWMFEFTEEQTETLKTLGFDIVDNYLVTEKLR